MFRPETHRAALQQRQFFPVALCGDTRTQVTTRDNWEEALGSLDFTDQIDEIYAPGCTRAAGR